MTTPARPLDNRGLWLVTVLSIVAILAVNYIVTGPSHVGSPIALRLAAAAIVTVFVILARFVAGPRAAAVTGVAGVLMLSLCSIRSRSDYPRRLQVVRALGWRSGRSSNSGICSSVACWRPSIHLP